MTPHPGRSRAALPPDAHLEDFLQAQDQDILRAVAADHRLNEDLALSLLKRRDLPGPVLESLSKNGAVMKHRKVIVGLVEHPRTPRHVAIPIARRLYTFELMQIALRPAVAADLKMVMEESLVGRLETISKGERLSLAKRASGRVAAALLLDSEANIVEAALANPQMTEAWIVKALMREEVPLALVEAASRHAKWSLRRDVRIALLRNENTPLARVLAFAQALPTPVLRDVLRHSRLPDAIKSYLEKELAVRDAARA
jgi:hypothetical protein